MAKKRRQDLSHGHLVIIGGSEDKNEDKRILSRFVELAGGKDKRIVVLTAASAIQEELWQTYQQAFASLGVRHCAAVAVNNREEANDAVHIESIGQADGIFMTGGDQRRLLAMIGGTEIDLALHRAFRERAACIAGTSAGASAMSEHMIADSKHEALPQKGSVYLAAGLGFMQRAVIDQHFSARQRLSRLLSIVAQNPYLLGIGIDEDTALVVERGGGLEVIGEGAVTLIDGRNMYSNFLDIDEQERLELINVKLHLLPAGACYRLPADLPSDRTEAINNFHDAILTITHFQNLS